MKNYKLHLAISDLSEHKDIEQFEFSNIDELTHKILNHKGLPEDRVYLCATHCADENETTEILITENYHTMQYFIFAVDELTYGENTLTVHVHMYESYEDAYAVALDMREANPLCYNAPMEKTIQISQDCIDIINNIQNNNKQLKTNEHNHRYN
jgi:hypothetical protein